jgi:hypothetical protein
MTAIKIDLIPTVFHLPPNSNNPNPNTSSNNPTKPDTKHKPKTTNNHNPLNIKINSKINLAIPINYPMENK